MRRKLLSLFFSALIGERAETAPYFISLLMEALLNKLFLLAALALSTSPALADEDNPCGISAQVVYRIQAQLKNVVTQNNGGLFSPNRMWSAIVDRKGVICSVTSIGDAWPGSRAIAVAKASTANDFSNDAFALSTAMLYGPTQPGGSLYGLNNSNPFDPTFLAQGSLSRGSIQTASTGALLGAFGPKVPGGIITFGGGVPLYSGKEVIGGLGVSGDTSCTDHVIAYRMRAAANLKLDPVSNGLNSDNIVYYPTATVDPTQFAQPHCTSHDVTP